MTRYHPALVALHWLLALLIVFSLAMGALRGHMVLGVAILVLMVVRFGVRMGTRRPALPGQGFLNQAAPLAHYGCFSRSSPCTCSRRSTTSSCGATACCGA